jgi:hypothetical protein
VQWTLWQDKETPRENIHLTQTAQKLRFVNLGLMTIQSTKLLRCDGQGGRKLRVSCYHLFLGSLLCL